MEIFGRFHPLILHLPVGILFLAFLMHWFGKKQFDAAVGFALKIGMWSAILAAISGFLLSKEGGYDENLLFWHQWAGILTGVFSVGLYFLHQKKEANSTAQKLFFPSFSATVILLFFTGHFGGSLTHGSDFLIEPFQPKEDPVITDLNNAVVFKDFIQPILKKKCNSCHNESKLKGELLLSSIEGIQKGGKTGAVFVLGDSEKSLIIQRIHLPLEEKKHMPPKGKTQLTEDEISLLEWWISTGADFEKTIGQSEVSEDVQTILNKYVEVKDEGVFALEISPASESKIEDLRAVGFSVYPIAQESPFLEATWKGDSLTNQILKKLRGISNQLIDLDLSNSNLNDNLFSVVKNLSNLRRLSLQKTRITGDALTNLNNHEYLEYLNLYGTKTDDSGVESVFELKRLNKLFLWQTDVTREKVDEIRKERPNLEVNIGTDITVFGDTRLQPPLIVAEKDIFRDTLTVELKISFKGVEIHYTLDGTNPDSTSAKYEKPFLLSETADLKVIARKEGWKTSEVAGRLFVRSKHTPKSITLDKQPAEKYAANGPYSLVDFKKGSESFTDGNWLGWQGTHVTATMDLGEKKEVSRVTISSLASPGSWIMLPKGMEILVSENGQNFKKVADKNFETNLKPYPPELRSFSERFPPETIRFIKVKVKSNLKNPKWHANSGEPCWVFLDEILAE